MKHNKHAISFTSLVTLAVLLSMANGVNAQERQTFPKEAVERARKQEQEKPGPQPPIPAVLGCKGPITQVLDVANENLRFTSANYFANPGGGEGGGFDKTPLLSTKVSLAQGVCLDAHFSGLVGSPAYGVAPLTLFQVSLTPANGGPPRHMIGHYEHPYGLNVGPAVFLGAEQDADAIASNFFQPVGMGPHSVPPGIYRVDVWWSGNGPGGAIGADFVLKLYLR